MTLPATLNRAARHSASRVAAATFAGVLCGALLLAGCSSEPYRKPAAAATYVVRKGDTVYSIAWRHGVDYRELARWNQLPADYAIYPGQVLYLKPVGQRRAPPPGAATPPPQPPPKVPLHPAPEDDVKVWVWPTEGAASAVSHSATGSAGLTISGQEGQAVRAAAAGKVVYTGSGLRGFGQLVIIKHSNVFLSAYGHNRALSVKEGDAVNAGQNIGEMGLGPNRQPMLYFEIRYNGQPVDPRDYLPPRPATP